MLHDLRNRLRAKLTNRQYVDNIIAKELAEASIKSMKEQRQATEEDEDYFTWYDGRKLQVQSLLLDVFFQFMQKDPNIKTIQLELANGQTYRLHLE